VEIILSVESCLFPEGLKKSSFERLLTVLGQQPADNTDWFYLRELSDDSVPTNRRKNTHA